MAEKPNQLVKKGIELHENGEYEAVLAKYRKALNLWPQNGCAHYEMGLTLRSRYEIRVSNREATPDSAVAIINSGRKNSPEVDAAFADARRHDPLQIAAYLEVIPLSSRVFWRWQKKGNLPGTDFPGIFNLI